MGVSMCSLSNEEKAELHEFQYDMEWDTSEEEEDTDDDDNEYFNLGKMGRCMSLPDLSDLDTISPPNRTKNKRYSYHRKTKDWPSSPVANSDAELKAKRWCTMVRSDTLKHLSHTVRIAGSIVERGVAMNDELARQDGLLSIAETDIAVSKYETEQVAETLKGMRCLRSKFKNVLWKKSPKVKINDFASKTSSFSNVKLEFEEDLRSCSHSTPDTSEEIQQIQIKTGLGQLHNALDIMAVQQMDVAWALDNQEGRFNIFERQLTSTNENINRQRRMINSIIGKS